MASEGKEGKSEGKDEGGGKYDDDVPTIDVTRLSAEPAIAPVTDELSLEIDFTSTAPIAGAQWTVKVNSTRYAAFISFVLLNRGVDCGVTLSFARSSWWTRWASAKSSVRLRARCPPPRASTAPTASLTVDCV